jgi:selenocysteine lyase/cysteine desulfurase
MARYTFPPLADKDRFGKVMSERRIVSPAGSGPDGGGGRLSTHIYNGRADVDWFADALCEIYGWS